MISPRADEILELADGRRLAYAEYGSAAGEPIFLFHGLPGSRLSWGLLPGEPIPAGLRVIAPDRPGYGRSDPKPCRSLACAWKMPERLTSVGVVSGPAPPDAAGVFVIRRNPARYINTMKLKVHEVDRQIVVRPEIQAMLARDFTEALRSGAQGMVDDMAANHGRSWGFPLEEIQTKVYVRPRRRTPIDPGAPAGRTRHYCSLGAARKRCALSHDLPPPQSVRIAQFWPLTNVGNGPISVSSDFYTQWIVPFAAIIIKVCRAYTDTQHDFEDYYQEVCLQIWRSHSSFDGRASWSTWVYRVSLNVCMTLFKTQKRKRRIFAADEVPPDLVADSRAPAHESLDRLYDAIRNLSEVDRAVILLYLDEKSYREIGEIIGANPNNVGVRINRIKERLRRLLDEEDD
jgi:RNA polymerase sigma-70 factor (ECF subfamily)